MNNHQKLVVVIQSHNLDSIYQSQDHWRWGINTTELDALFSLFTYIIIDGYIFKRDWWTKRLLLTLISIGILLYFSVLVKNMTMKIDDKVIFNVKCEKCNKKMGFLYLILAMTLWIFVIIFVISTAIIQQYINRQNRRFSSLRKSILMI